MTLEITLKRAWNKVFALAYEESDGKVVKRELKWLNIVSITLSHGVAFYSLFFAWRHATFRTYLFSNLYGFCSGVGVTAGVHRLWSHRSYKAKLPLRILLAVFFSMTGQNSILQWVLDHRVHHKYTETDADPHNASRGFFFAHVGWLMQTKSKEVKTKGKQMDMSDLLADPVVRFHTKFFIPMKILFAFVLPTVVPVYFWGETWTGSILVSLFLRYIISLNNTWLVNSAAHLWGDKPYDIRIGPVENKTVAYLALGEGWHNYHHVFPWDYKASEYGVGTNITTKILHFFAWLGWAYDLKSPSAELVDKVANKYGDGSRRPFEVLPPTADSKEQNIGVVYLADDDDDGIKSD